MKIGFLKKL